MDERTPPWDIDGPVQAEVYVFWLDGDHIAWTGPCGPAPWLLELGAADHPLDVVDRIVRDTIGPPLLVHSTSWRRDRDAVILSFVVVIESLLVGDMQSIRVDRAELARSEATAAPRQIDHRQVIEQDCVILPGSRSMIRSSAIRCRTSSGRCLPGMPRSRSGHLARRTRSVMEEGTGTATLALRCACGWEVRGTEKEVVEAAQEHGRRIHNMSATRDEVLAMATDASDEPR